LAGLWVVWAQPVRLNLPVSAPVLTVCHDDAGWCAGPSTFERPPASLVLA